MKMTGSWLAVGVVSLGSLALAEPAAGAPADPGEPVAAAPADAAPGLAEQLGVQIHGFGNRAYGVTNHYDVGAATPTGSVDNLAFSLALSAQPVERLTVAAQPFFAIRRGEREAVIDYAFAEVHVADWLRVRAGAVKQPFGIYTEVFDVGTLRPFAQLPLGLYSDVGLVAESHLGAGVTGTIESASGWGLQYDLYGGQLSLPSGNEAAGVVADAATGDEESVGLRNVVGGRLVVQTVIPQLRAGVSGYSGEHASQRHSGYGVHVDYTGDALWLRAEAARVDHESTLDTAYVELAYRVLESVQLAARVEGTRQSGLEAGLPASLSRDLEVAAGVSYWVGSAFVVRASYHYIRGNRFASPGAEALAERVAELGPGETLALHDTTHLATVGVAFSF